MPSWPSTLPDISLGLTETPQDGAIRTAMSAGPVKIRRRFSAVSRSVSASLMLTTTERATFDTFREDTLSQGALSFDMDDPRDGTSQTWRFAGVPTFTSVTSDNNTVKLWRADFPLEILP